MWRGSFQDDGNWHKLVVFSFTDMKQSAWDRRQHLNNSYATQATHWWNVASNISCTNCWSSSQCIWASVFILSWSVFWVSLKGIWSSLITNVSVSFGYCQTGLSRSGLKPERKTWTEKQEREEMGVERETKGKTRKWWGNKHTLHILYRHNWLNSLREKKKK